MCFNLTCCWTLPLVVDLYPFEMLNEMIKLRLLSCTSSQQNEMIKAKAFIILFVILNDLAK